jgi:hypothetical protein
VVVPDEVTVSAMGVTSFSGKREGYHSCVPRVGRGKPPHHGGF